MTFDDDSADCLLLSLTLRPVLAADLGAASVSHGISEWALVWVLASDLQLLWQLLLMLEWKLPLQSL
jgi:hypothetical protein